MTAPDEVDPQVADRLRQYVNGYQVTQAISALVALGVPERLAKGPRTAEDLAAEAGADPRALYRLLRALGALGILVENHTGGERTFALTDMGQLLRPDVPGSVADWAAFVTRPYHWDAWAGLLRNVQTGQQAFVAQHGGEDIWAWRERHPDESRIFDSAMSAIAADVATRLANTFDFAGFRTLVDLGGGDGTLLATILPRHPTLRGVLFDLPHVVSGAQQRLQAAGVADRCEVIAGNFFERVPAGFDAYVVKSILHDWNDDAAIRILERIGEASPDATLLIVERSLADADPTPSGAMSDLNMMVNTGGAERTVTEWAELTRAAGFELNGSIDIGHGWGVLQATRQ